MVTIRKLAVHLAAFVFVGVVLGPSPAAGGPARVATTASARDFLSGEAKGVTVSADGRVRLGLDLAPRVWPEEAAEAVIFAAATGRDGRLWVATGGGKGRLWVVPPDGRPALVFAAREPHLTAVAVSADGAVVCASSPNGTVYRIDPHEKDPGKSGTVWVDPKEAAIWSLAFGPDGRLYIGTGNKGRIYRSEKGATPSLLAEIEDSVVRSLAVGADGTVFAGSSDKGMVLAISPAGALRTLHDFSRPEVAGLALRPDGAILAAASTATAILPASMPTTPRPAPPAVAAEVPRGTVSVATSVSTTRKPSASSGGTGSGADVVLIRTDGVVEPAWSFPEDAIYGVRWDAGSASFLIATGPRGRLYSLKDGRLELLAQTDEKQVVAAPAGAAGLPVLVTMNAAGVLRPVRASGREGSFLAAVKDARRVSSFGRIRADGEIPAGTRLRLRVRSGNAEKPDGTWSPWTAVSGETAKVPAARYFQWRADFAASGRGESPVLERVEFTYAEANLRPVLESVTVLEPGAVWARSSSSSSPNVLSVANPDENGAFAGLDPPHEAGPDGGGKKLWRKGYRTVSWKGADPNSDALRYQVEVRREGTPAWMVLRKEIEDPWISFDTTALPDGRYRFRVTASDRASNPEGEALETTAESEVAVVDNTPPVVAVEGRRLEGNEIVLTIVVEDALSLISRAEGTVNADRWRVLSPEAGVLDSSRARVRLRAPLPAGPALVTIRVIDAAGNVAAVSASYPEEFR